MNADALEKALNAADFGPEKSAWVQAAKSLAGLVDEDPTDTDLWREYRLVLKALGEGGGGESDAFDEWLRTQVSHTEDGPAHARAETRRSR